MNKEKVYLEGYVVGYTADTLGYKGLQIQLENLDIVEIDKNLVHKGINEPQKVTIPQFVADWIEKCKSEKRRLHESLTYTPYGVNGWVSNPKNQETFARAWLDGYEVEKEKRYTIKFKNIRKETRYLKYDRVVQNWYFGVEQYSKETKIYHTRKEIEDAGFGWVFDCEGIEIEEVE